MVGYSQIETGVARRVHNIRMQGNTAKLHIALDGLPEFKGLSEQQLGQRLLIAPTMDYIEQAFNACKYGEYSKAPAIDISIPSMHDSSLAPMVVMFSRQQFNMRPTNCLRVGPRLKTNLNS